MADADSLVVAINSIPAGEPVKLKIRRRDETIERTVRLAKLRLNGPVIATNRPAPWRGLRVDYTSTLAGTTFDAAVFEAMAREGVVVTEVESGSEAEKAGLKTGQLISRVDGQPVRNPREFAKAVRRPQGPRQARDRPGGGDGQVTALVERDGVPTGEHLARSPRPA